MPLNNIIQGTSSEEIKASRAPRGNLGFADSGSGESVLRSQPGPKQNFDSHHLKPRCQMAHEPGDTGTA